MVSTFQQYERAKDGLLSHWLDLDRDSVMLRQLALYENYLSYSKSFQQFLYTSRNFNTYFFLLSTILGVDYQAKQFNLLPLFSFQMIFYFLSKLKITITLTTMVYIFSSFVNNRYVVVSAAKPYAHASLLLLCSLELVI